MPWSVIYGGENVVDLEVAIAILVKVYGEVMLKVLNGNELGVGVVGDILSTAMGTIFMPCKVWLDVTG